MGRGLQLVRAPDEPSDVDDVTLARAMRGDRAAFRVLVERFERPVFALLSRMLFRSGREFLVEDLAQECFVRVFGGLPAFGRDGRANLPAWILTIAARLAIDELRKRPLADEPLDRAALAIAARDGSDGSDGNAEARSDRARVGAAIERAVAALTPEFRATFLLREVHEMDYESIAAALRVDVGTVKSRLNRARLALRRALQGIYDER